MPDDTYLDDILMDWSKQLDQIACSDGWDYEESADNINRKYAGLVAQCEGLAKRLGILSGEHKRLKINCEKCRVCLRASYLAQEG